MTTKWWLAALLLIAACGGPGNTSIDQPSRSSHAPGPLADTWSWDGATWHAAIAGGPSPRYAASLAYDAQHKTYVLFGGQTSKGSSDETWLWDGRRWTAASPSHKPSARRDAAMAYDPEHEMVVLYGGRVQDTAEGQPAADTWGWDGNDWTVLSDFSDTVGQRLGSRMVTAGSKIILFGGGVAPNDSLYGNAWTWDGHAWAGIDREPRPPGRHSAAVAWNPADSSLLVFGGSGLDPNAGPGAGGLPLSDTWSLKGGAWTRRASTGPPATGQVNAVWQVNEGRLLVMFGTAGTNCPKATNAVWAWDGTAWSQLARAAPPPRWGAALAQAADGTALVFGGSDEPGC